MTKEEARILIEKTKPTDNSAMSIMLREALDMAIKDMKQESPCEDCISRQAVKEQMIKYGFHAPDMTVTEFVEGLPPVTPQPKTGHWYRKHSWEICFTCSKCETTNASGTQYNYCPSCGARMAEREG